MKRILVPMDFTNVAMNALKYATEAFPESSITVLHVKVGNMDTIEPIPISMATLQKDYWISAMNNFIKKEFKTKETPEQITINVRYGLIIHEIKTFSKEQNFDGIVMGTRDKYNLIDQWFGTISIGTVKTTKIPVYLIPKYSTYKGVHKVMVATDEHINEPLLIKKISDWNKKYNAFIKFLHIRTSQDECFTEEYMAIISELIEKNECKFNFEIATLFDKDVPHTLLAAAYDMRADLLMVIPENQNFLQSVLYKSTTKDLIFKSNTPLLFIRY